jgi:uncharacterized membrane protein
VATPGLLLYGVSTETIVACWQGFGSQAPSPPLCGRDSRGAKHVTETDRPDHSTSETVPAHVEDTVQAVARFNSSHEAEAGRLQRGIENLTRRAASPAFAALLTALIASWIAFNLSMMAVGRTPIDKPPFFWIQGAITLIALYMTVFILTTQRREDKLAGLRDQLTLELAILGEQKSAKIIGLLEELRRDAPNISDRADEHADALSTPADPNAVLNALKETQEPIR